MSERKVLNKYYPPDFDPTKIPKLKQARNRTYCIRIMAPFNMRCNTCGEYIYKGKKFNSRKETVEDETYLGLYIFRFYIKCPRCVSEIAFKTDPQNTDYSLEDGATRNFEAARTAEEMAKKEAAAKEEEEANNPMKVLENRTKSSQREMEMVEALEELREINSRHAKVDHEYMLKLNHAYAEQLRKLQEEEDEAMVKSIFGKSDDDTMKRLEDEEVEEEAIPVKKMKTETPTSILLSEETKPKTTASWQKSVGGLGTKAKLGQLVKKKDSNATSSIPPKEQTPASSGPSTKAKLGQLVKKKENGSTVNVSPANKQVPRSSDTSTKAKLGQLVKKKDTNSTVNTPTAKEQAPAPSGLSLLGAYSDDDSSSDG